MKPNYQVNESFYVQFVWKLPDGDFLRAVFQADILKLAMEANKYIVYLTRLVAGRQETATGTVRPQHELSPTYWPMVHQIVGQRVSLAFEADDGRPLHMRLVTLTGEHDFFRRFEDVADKTKGMPGEVASG